MCAWVLAVCVVCASRAESYILISEVLADPPSGISGDANRDGIVSSSQDEFVELYNHSVLAVDLKGWSIADALKERHVFASESWIGPWSTVVVFGGSQEVLTDPFWFTASTGGLGINNTADSIRLYDQAGSLVDEFQFGPEGGMDVSLVRTNPLYDSTIKLSEGKPFSPGETHYEPSMAVAEPSSLLLFLMAGGWAGLSRARKAFGNNLRIVIRSATKDK